MKWLIISLFTITTPTHRRDATIEHTYIQTELLLHNRQTQAHEICIDIITF
jgi:hypothetical protein